MTDEKILENEILNDEDLEKVAGGTISQVAYDNKFLKKIGGSYYLGGDFIYEAKAVASAWKKFGVRMEYDPEISRFENNKYFIGDKEVSRKDAFRHALSQRGWNDVAIDCFDFSDYE